MTGRRAAAGAITVWLAVCVWTAPASAQDLLAAAQAGDVETVRALAGSGADMTVARGDGMNALHLAAERGHADVASVLIEAGTPFAAGTRIGDYTPLHIASRRGSGEIVRLLLDAGADPNRLTTTSEIGRAHV